MARTRARSEFVGNGVSKLARPGGPIYRDLYAKGKRVEGAAKRRLSKHVDTGRGRASITTQMKRRGEAPVARIGTNVGYMRLLHDGTGRYGPRRRDIRPVRAKVLAWKSRKTGKYVFARSVRGIKPVRFLTRGMRDVMGRKRGKKGT